MRTYDESLKIYWDNYSVIETAKHEGREQGRQQERIEIAKELKKNGVSVDIIIKSTGLTKEQIETL